MTKNEKVLFSLRSNLNIAQMRHRCPTARVVGTAEIDGYELLFKGSGTGAYLTIEKAKGKSVPVAVWKSAGMMNWRLTNTRVIRTFTTKRI